MGAISSGFTLLLGLRVLHYRCHHVDQLQTRKPPHPGNWRKTWKTENPTFGCFLLLPYSFPLLCSGCWGFSILCWRTRVQHYHFKSESVLPPSRGLKGKRSPRVARPLLVSCILQIPEVTNPEAFLTTLRASLFSFPSSGASNLLCLVEESQLSETGVWEGRATGQEKEFPSEMQTRSVNPERVQK